MPNAVKYLDVTGTQALVTEIKNRLATKLTQYSEMPTPAATNVNSIVQYIGQTNSNYTQGDFYLGDTGEPSEVQEYITSTEGITGALEVVSDDAEEFDESTQIKVSNEDLIADLPDVKVGDYVKLQTKTVPNYLWTKITYNIDEINQRITVAGSFAVVDSLPTTDIMTNVIYLVPKTVIVKQLTGYRENTTDEAAYFVPQKNTNDEIVAYDVYSKDTDGDNYIYRMSHTDASTVENLTQSITNTPYIEGTFNGVRPEANNVKDEYINIDGTTNGWEKIGSTQIDLSNYVTFDDLVAITSSELDAMWEV